MNRFLFVSIFIVLFISFFKLVQDYSQKEIFFSLSTGFIVTTIFWLISIYLPQRKKKKILIKNFRYFFVQFKSNLIRILLQACEKYKDESQINNLLEYKNFKDFFGNQNKKLFYNAINIINENNIYISKIIIEFELLNIETYAIINNVDVLNKDLYNFSRALNENLYRLKNDINLKNDQINYLSTMLWSYLANYSQISGYSEEDLFNKMISKI